jgi:hypothetical protein
MSPIDAEPTGWLPVIHLGGDRWVGLVGLAELFVGSRNGAVRRVERDAPTGLLPLLERPRAVVKAEIDEWEATYGAGLGVSGRIIPLDAVVLHALTSGSEYWAGLAIEWVDAMPETQGVVEALDALVTARWASQSLRHGARRALRSRWR